MPSEGEAPASVHLMTEVLDPAWYLNRYPDIAASNTDAYHHFSRYGAAEKRDPNAFFDSTWYIEHYADVAASGLIPLQHYLQAGAPELRNPHPRFDAVYYVEQHPDAAENPLLYHLRVGLARGYPTEKIIDIGDYLPSRGQALSLPRAIFADVIILLGRDAAAAKRCVGSVLACRDFPLARIIVVDDQASDPELHTWLRQLSAERQILLIRNRRRMGVARSADRGMEATADHDIVLLSSDSEVNAGWLQRLTAHAYSQPKIATVSPLGNLASLGRYQDADGAGPAIDELCRLVNVGRSATTETATDHCLYIRRAAMLAVGGLGGKPSSGDDLAIGDLGARATAAGWLHRIAFDTFSPNDGMRSIAQAKDRYATSEGAAAFQFAIAAALFRRSGLPVILMISHDFGGGVRRHIDSLVERFGDTARVLLLQATDRGAALSLPAMPGDPPNRAVLTLPAERLDDLVAVLRSANLSRIHIHHLLRIDLDIRALIHRLRLPFDVTVHDYFAICPQVNLLRWPEGIYCGEPGPADCNACIAEKSSHGARDIVSWRRGWAWQFIEADRVICPSADVKARLDRHGIGARAIVVPHEPQAGTTWATRLPRFTKPPLRIVLLGALANHKGSRCVAEVAQAAAAGSIELHLIGYLEDSFPKPAAKLIKVTGQYLDGDLPALLKRIDPHVFWFPSTAAETYSYTLSTAIETGRPIVATDLGSFTERLAARPLSWLVDHRASAKTWLATFDAVRTTLCGRDTLPPAPRRTAISDFYTDCYLSPARSKRSATAAGKPRIVIVPERYDTGGLTPCGYIRLLQPLDHPSIGGRFETILADAETVFDHRADIIVTQRSAVGDVATANRLARHARETGARLLLDLDDDLLNIPRTHPDAAALRPLAPVVRRMLAIADVVWVSTPGLADCLSSLRQDAIVVENRLDERIWTQPPARDRPWDDPIRILCMGTRTHERDFAMIEPALLRLKAEHGHRIVIDVLGMTSRSELPAALNRIGPPTHASRSYPGFVNWMTAMRPRWHIGLAPLLDTAFNRAKSPIKAMDYAALGLAVLASDTPVYRGSIADGPAGHLVTNDPIAWHAALDWMIRNPDLRVRSAKAAREAFLSQATLASDGGTRKAALAGLLPPRASGRDSLRRPSAALTIPHGSVDPVARQRRHSDRRR
ncbi:glycosyltransferase [Rhodopila sp.]|uniref:glycosyltransferase n=1 Tax=Rhodopila sp. TaxID=2480087 RepID=UPI003D0C6005